MLSHLLRRPEDSYYAFGPDGHELTIYRAGITAPIVEAVRESPVTLALSVAHPLVILIYQFFPKEPRGNAAFAWHLIPQECRMMLERDRLDVPSRLTIRLVNSDDFAVHSVRQIDLSPDFACQFCDAIHTQASRPFDPVAYVRAIATVHLDSRDLWAQQERLVVSMMRLE
jgi:hypothetical protein